jgi:hypothetical protein
MFIEGVVDGMFPGEYAVTPENKILEIRIPDTSIMLDVYGRLPVVIFIMLQQTIFYITILAGRLGSRPEFILSLCKYNTKQFTTK